ncbi:hypothetical protein DAPPUDRAFT_237361 [Daphnia pulex]|uniref:NAD(+) diphosphatase n=1 Tax=Daphnia pulex TaxID=6669 RepID=E9G3Q8_DAPPU|nr:hypothetical protein DAPPUDRAFT_237361 [Daphnia pulex]|eukprot:EFX85807.1 hypothetical protein DAPPUDRAFT_237361 [Daphnia pulex]
MLQNLREKTGMTEEVIKNGKCLVYYKGDPLLTEDFNIAWMDFADLGVDPKLFLEHALLLGMTDAGQFQFAVQIVGFGKELKQAVLKKSQGNFTDFRLSLMMMPTSESALASKAKAIFNWHRRNTHCAKCGGPSARNSTASCRTCSKCEEVWYPSLSPVGIVLVADSLKTKLLLVRQGRHPKGMYSCIAGYVDSGETLEEGIRREVAEEVGLTVLSVDYKASQHWSFPTSNLMIGCHAIVSGNEVLDVDTSELEDARWFSVDEVRRSLISIKANPLETMTSAQEGTNNFFVPPRGTLAHSLIDSWLSN